MKTPFILFGSTQLQRRLRVVAWALVGAAALLMVVLAVMQSKASLVAFALVVISALLVAISSRIRVPDAQCVLCLRSRAVVLSLIAGEHAGVCDDCSVTAAALATKDQFTRAASKSLWAMSVLKVMPDHTPNTVSAPLLQLAWNIEGVDRNAVLEQAGRLQNQRVKVSLYEETNEEARSSNAWINLGVSLNACGRFDEALAATRRATEASNEPWVLNNIASISLRAGRGGFESLLVGARRARTLLVEQKSPSWEAALPVFINNIAELELRLGRAAAALALLDESATLTPPNARALITRHAALSSLGRTDEAKAASEQAKQLAHPDSLEAAEVAALS